MRSVLARLLLSFSLILLLMITQILFGYRQLDEFSHRIELLSGELANRLASAKDIATGTALARDHARAYVAGQSSTDLDRFRHHLNKLQEEIARLHPPDSEEASPVTAIQVAVTSYRKTFSEISAIIEQRQKITYGSLNHSRYQLENELNGLEIVINSQEDSSQFLTFGKAQEAFFTLLLHSREYTRKGDERYAVLADRSQQRLLSAFQLLKKTLTKPAEREKVTTAEAGSQAYYHAFLEIRDGFRKQLQLLELLYGPLENEIIVLTEQLVENTEQKYLDQKEKTRHLLAQTRTRLLVSTLFTVLLGLILGHLLARSITRPLREIVQSSRTIAHEDLAILTQQLSSLSKGDVKLQFKVQSRPLHIRSRDELGETASSFNQVIYQLHEAESAFTEMSRYLNKVAHLARRVADGQLDTKIEKASPDDELAEALTEMLHSLSIARQEVADYQLHLEEQVTARTSELEESRRLLATLMSNLPGMAYRCENERDWRMIFVSEGASALTGYPASALHDNHEKAFGDLIHRDDRERVWSQVQEAINQDRPFVLLYRLQTKNGSIKWVWERGQLVTGPDGKRKIIEGFITDITERVEAEQALEEKQRELKAIFKASPEPLVVYGPQGIPSHLSPSFTRVFGWNLSELADSPLYLASESDRSRFLQTLAAAKNGELASIKLETKGLTSDGRQLDLLLNTVPIAGGGQAVSLTDISKTKELEEKIRQAHKMEAVGTLAGGVAHEFNNMLAVIIGNIELASNNLDDTAFAASCLKEVHDASLRAKDVVSKLLSFSRKGQESRRVFAIAQATRDTLALLRKTIPSTIEIRQRIHCTDQAIFADSTEIGQVLINLCSNAAHAIGSQGGRITVSLEETALTSEMAQRFPLLNEGQYIRLTVEDTGAGITGENLERIWEPYFTTKQIHEGLGMGLALVHGIISRHAGAVDVTSELGKGTTVEILLPMTKELPNLQQQVAEPFHQGGSERLLVVDDEPSLVALACAVLKGQGYQVEGISDSQQALHHFRQNPERYQLVVTDLTMPGMPGDQLAARLQEVRPDTPVILCTGYESRLDRKAAAKAGIRAILGKPYTSASLSSLVRQVLDGNRFDQS